MSKLKGMRVQVRHVKTTAAKDHIHDVPKLLVLKFEVDISPKL